MTDSKGQKIIESRFLQTCDMAVEESIIEPFTMVIFGGAGDLARRKLVPALCNLYRENEFPRKFSVLGFGRREMDDVSYRSLMKEAVEEFGEGTFDDKGWDEFGRRLFYLSGGSESDEDFKRLNERIIEISNPTSKRTTDVIYYMAVPPEAAPPLIERLKGNNLCKGAFSTKIIMEKPFGKDRQSAVALNKIVTGAFNEEQIYRIDHYLAKEPVQNIMFFRFSNAIFEQLWNCLYIDNVQITVAEDIGIEHRGEFYEQAGVVRDIVQNHVMQLIGTVAMEPPVGFKDDFIRDEKVKIMRSMRHMDEAYIDKFTVRGQYGAGIVNGQEVPAYRQEKKASPFSNTPTFFAAKFYIDNLRWAAVPFYVRTGKRLQKRVTEICIQFKHLPLRLFGRTCDVLEPDILILTIQPDEKISLHFGVKYPYSNNQIYSVDMVFDYHATFKASFYPAYERLLIDCMKGNLTLFVRQDAVEAMWEVVDPIIARWESVAPLEFPNYAAGTWGPGEAALLVEQEGRRWITR